MLLKSSFLDIVRNIHHIYSSLGNANNEQEYKIMFISVTDGIIPVSREQFFSTFRMLRKQNNDAKNVQYCKKKQKHSLTKCYASIRYVVLPNVTLANT